MKVAISGYSGCGNTTATKNLGKKLNIKSLNYTFRSLAEQLGVPYQQVHEEASTNAIYDYLTDLVCIRFSLENNIAIGNRLSAWIMDADLNIWLKASLEQRARRIYLREGSKRDYEKILYTTLKRDDINRQRYLKLYGLDIDDHKHFDLEINTETLTIEQVSSLIVAASLWVNKNQLKRNNIHIYRLHRIISERLNIPLKSITDINSPLDIKKIFKEKREIFI